MNKVSSSLNWLGELENIEFDSIDNDFIVFENFPKQPSTDYPFKIDVTTIIICIKGSLEGFVDLKHYKAEAPCFLVILPDQILEHRYQSDDFSGKFIIMSKKITESLIPSHEKLPVFFSIRNNTVFHLSEKELVAILTYHEFVQKIIKQHDHPNRIEVIRYLTMAFFSWAAYYFHPQTEEKKSSNQELLVEKYLNLLKSNYKKHRGLEFYSDKMFLTPKHISQVIKDVTSKTASDWIDDFVILEAKALLKSTNMTIQQISDDLNFPDQSSFGKYFKRIVGVSPRKYKERK